MSLTNLVYAQQQENLQNMGAVSTADISQDNEGFYAHKKFNCSAYKHKKFGSSFMRSLSVECLHGGDDNSNSSSHKLFVPNEALAEVEDESQDSTATGNQTTAPKAIFRPYALGENTPRKRRTRQQKLQHPLGQLQQQQQTQQPIGSVAIDAAAQLQRMRVLYTSEGGNLHHLHLLQQQQQQQQLQQQHCVQPTQQSGAPYQAQLPLQQHQQQQRLVSTTAPAPHSMLPQQPRQPQFTMNHRTLAIMLQKQREALYMRQVLQLNGVGLHLPPSHAGC